MNLSTAIRIGSMTTKQITGASTDGSNGRCAIGAAIDAAGEKVEPFNWPAQAGKLFPILSDPHGRLGLSVLAWTIVFMNDDMLTPREIIADYVELCEASFAPREAEQYV